MALGGRWRPSRATTVAERRAAGARSLLSMPNVTRPGRGPLTVEDHVLDAFPEPAPTTFPEPAPTTFPEPAPTTFPEPVEGRRVRSYRPPSSSDVLPAHVLIHGGAYWAGSVEGHDPLCAWYARSVPCQVFSVDYRLAPEHPYPAGVEDCYAALVWVAEHAAELGVDPSRISVGGVSAGGGLAAAVGLLARDRSGPALCLQLLEIPMLDPTMSQPSLDTYATGFGLSREDVAVGWRHYLADGAPDAYAGASGADDLTGLPPAAVLTDGCDPLRDEGEAYAARLRSAGVPVSTYRASGHVHSSHYLTRFLPSARRAVAWSTDALRRAYAA